MRLIALLLVLSATGIAIEDSSAEVVEHSDLPVGHRIELLNRGLSGDLDALAALDHDGEASRWDSLYQGFALQASGQLQRAVSAWQSSVEKGHRLAVRALAAHHYDQREWVEAYAWARLAMEVDAALQDTDIDGLRGTWPLHVAIHSAEELDDEQHDRADELARERAALHLSRLVSPVDVGSQPLEQTLDLDIVRRSAPRYPRGLWEQGVPGWAYLQFEVKANGRVGQVAAVGASNDRFARAAVRALRDWRFDTEAMDELPTMATQQFDFSLQR